jgi:hypothetical protein
MFGCFSPQEIFVQKLYLYDKPNQIKLNLLVKKIAKKLQVWLVWLVKYVNLFTISVSSVSCPCLPERGSLFGWVVHTVP